MEALTLADIPAEQAAPWLGMADKFAVLGDAKKNLRCLGIFDGGKLCGAISVIAAGEMLWLDRGGGKRNGAPIARELPPVIEVWARANGFRSIATATKRRGYVERLKVAGFDVAGTIMKRDIK